MEDAVFAYTGDFKVTDAMKAAYDEFGFFVVKNFLDEEELGQIWKTLDETNGILQHSYTTTEPDGKKIRRVVFQQPGDDVTGIVARSEKLVDSCEKLLGGEVYHYHSKFILKNPYEGGRHVWHQDYGYWYANNLLPEMISVWMPLDKATKRNSCMQVLKGSHKCGRIEHLPAANLQTQCDLERLEAIKTKCPHLYCEMEPGAALFLHCNTIHTSDPNNSEMRRWAFIPTYNKASNGSFRKHHHASYTPLHKVPSEAIKTCRNYTDFAGKDFTADPVKNPLRSDIYPKVVGK